AAYRAPGRILVSAPAEFLGDDADVDVALGSHADAIAVALGLLEEDDGLNFPDGQRLIDEAFRVVVRAPRGASHRVIEKEDADPVRRVERHPAKDRGQQLQPAHAVAVEDLP